MSLVGMPYTILMPVFARDILHGGPHTLGFLMGSAGLGALTGTLYLAARRSVLGLGRWLVRAAVIFGVGLIGFAFSRYLPLSYLLVAIVGFGLIVHMASCNTLLQTIADDDKRGRVMSFYTMAFMGITPLGSLLAGSLASWIGAPATLWLAGGASLAGALVFARHLPSLRRQVHPIYIRMGILPELAQGIQTATEPTRPSQS
jgi:MFS family permease